MLDLLFETSWEVCNKVGGIYAVLSTKAKTLQKRYKDHLIFIGPDIWTDEMPSPYFIEAKTWLSSWQASAQLPAGLSVRVGRWDVPGKPLTILVGFQGLYGRKNELYSSMWNRFGVDSLHAYGDYDESCVFAYASALVIESLVTWPKVPPQRVVAHFDEWTTGMGLLYIKAHQPQVATVFTTHATSIGRSICGNGKPLYDYFEGYHGDQMADELNMQSKHSLEKAAAHQCDVFTTVSEVTARECEQLLERRPLVTPNGFESNFVPRGKQMQEARERARHKMLSVASALTGESYSSDTLLIATSGRYEVRNKGIDAYLDAINEFRFALSHKQHQRQVIAWVMVPAWVKSPRADLANSLARNQVERLFNPIVTHHLHNEEHDYVLGKINAMGMHNQNGDPIAIIDVPCYLTGNDGIFDMSYYDLLVGLDATIFPSYYEPWGYTPLESAAFGVPTITSDLSGFGQWVLQTQSGDSHKAGVAVVHRSDSNYSETVHQLCMRLLSLYQMDAASAHKLSNAALKTSKLASWEHFMQYYDQAYEQALNAAVTRQKKR